MAEKKQRRERLSTRDHTRAGGIAAGAIVILMELEKQYPTDLDLKISLPALMRFRDSAMKAAQDSVDGGGDAEAGA